MNQNCDQQNSSQEDMLADKSVKRQMAPIAEAEEKVLVRGAVSVAFDPIYVTWRSIFVPLSPLEGQVYAHIFRRGRVQVSEIDELLSELGAKLGTRSLIIGHIRGKFVRLGACDPFERLGNQMLRLQVDADDVGRTLPIVGLLAPRYVSYKAD